MKLIAQVKLQPTDDQALALKHTMERANEACNHLSDVAWETRYFRQYSLHKLAYHATRAAFPDLSSQVIVRCIARVADAYKLDKKSKRQFRPLSAIAYDLRILRWYTERSMVSIWTVSGRQKIPFVCGDMQRELLKLQQGESDLVYRDGEFFLYATCNVEEPLEGDPSGFLGVDLGVVNLAVDSDGQVYSAAQVNNVRHHHRRLRRKLQQKGSHSAKRRLKKLAGREKRFAKDVNHCISKRIVEKAERTGRGIALEELTGIRSRIRARKPQRATLHSWSFAQLRGFISYKARRKGVPVAFVDPAYTSQTCPVCGCVDKKNRSDQSTFSCVSCGFSGLADTVAARNIAGRAVVNRPNVAGSTAQLQAPRFIGE
jgi:IS605 OrfB family transposase